MIVIKSMLCVREAWPSCKLSGMYISEDNQLLRIPVVTVYMTSIQLQLIGTLCASHILKYLNRMVRFASYASFCMLRDPVDDMCI